MVSDRVQILLGTTLVVALLGVWWFVPSVVPTHFLVQNALFVSVTAVVLLFAFWAMLESEEGDSKAETVSKVFKRAEDRTNGVLTTGRVTLGGLAGIGAIALPHFVAGGAALYGLLDPMTWAAVGTGILGALGMTGHLPLKWFVGLAILLIALAELAGRGPITRNIESE